MTAKRAKADPQAGPFHAFKVTHITRPGHGAPGSSEVTSGHLNGADAVEWILAAVRDHQLDPHADVHPAHGVPYGLAEALGLEGTQAATAAAAQWAQGQLAGGDPAGPGPGEGASGDDG